MKQITNWDEIKEATDFPQLQPGGYVAKILNVKDVADKEYLEIVFDIDEGEFKDHYKKIYKAKNFWGSKVFRSYKETATSFFKSFITAVEKSNPGYKFDWNEKKLIGKKIGVVLYEEEYQASNGDIKDKLACQELRSVQSIKDKDFKIKPKKLLNGTSSTATTTTTTTTTDTSFDVSEDDIQF